MSKPQYTAAQVAAALRECKGLVYLAARRLGCHPRTVHRYKAKHESVRDACEVERGEMVDLAEAALFRAVKEGRGWAVCFYLKTQGKDRGYVEKSQLDLSGEVTVRRYVGIDPEAV